MVLKILGKKIALSLKMVFSNLGSQLVLTKTLVKVFIKSGQKLS